VYLREDASNFNACFYMEFYVDYFYRYFKEELKNSKLNKRNLIIFFND